MKAVITYLLALLFVVGAGMASTAQEILKHPRVVELEDTLKNSASDYVKARFPSVPFMVTVRVDPLRRELRRLSGEATADLPYYTGDEDEELRDEWDNPQVPLSALINRVRRIRVDLAVPAKLKQTEIDELKDGIFQILHMTPARDEVAIARRDWTVDEVPWMALYSAGGILISLLVGLLAINRTSANRIARALGTIKLQTSNGGPSGVISSPVLDSKPEAPRSGHELKFNDPIKMKELASRHIEFLASSSAFPNHRDLFALDALGKQNPERLGAILGEFPAETQRRIFSYSAEFYWVEAMNRPGHLDLDCLEALKNLIQHSRSEPEMAWSQTIMAVWRLGEARTTFVKGLSKEEAFALLAEMPKAVAVSEARRAFPGSWAAVLDPDFKVVVPPAVRLKEIKTSAEQVLAPHDVEMVRHYRQERELLDYLREVDPTEERDIYGAAPETSLIHRLRPPFFRVFDQSVENLQWFVPCVPLDQWALALFNVTKPDRGKIDTHLSEKQRFLLVEKLKQFDASPPNSGAIGIAREKIGSTLLKWLRDKSMADAVNKEKGIDIGQGDGNVEAA